MALLTTCDRYGCVGTRIHEEDSHLHRVTLIEGRTCGIYAERPADPLPESPQCQTSRCHSGSSSI
jgi:hypothetical protein